MTNAASIAIAHRGNTYATWASQRRRPGLGLLTGAIVRTRPVVLQQAAVAICVLSGIAMLLIAARALLAMA